MRKPMFIALVFSAGLLVAPTVSIALQYETGVPKNRSAVGYLDLHTRDDAGSLDGPEEFARYSEQEALMRLDAIRDYLKSFSALTDKVRATLGETELEAVGNTAPDESLGFHNSPLTIEGTILKQTYQLKQAQYELALMKHTRGSLSTRKVNQARDEYAKAAKEFQVFWDTKLFVN